jgi:hypothetical protein
MDACARVGLTELWATGVAMSQEIHYVPGRGFLEWLAADLKARGLTPRFVDVRFVDAPYYSLTNDW